MIQPTSAAVAYTLKVLTYVSSQIPGMIPSLLLTIGVNTFDGLYYTLINYKANNDSGMVIQKNFQWSKYLHSMV
ncbi:MAG: hypothetical protein IPM91_20120 [Bacteroidetes bacterium]|nr:hypothetical protein [Bacteroidota bacterium]